MEHYIVNRKVKNEKQAFAKINQLAFALAKITSENFRACRQLIYYSLGFVLRTPDHDERTQNPFRSLSIVVDLYK